MHRCDRCKNEFPDKDELGRRIPQKNYLANSAYVKIGSSIIGLSPRMCYACLDEVKEIMTKVLHDVKATIK